MACILLVPVRPACSRMCRMAITMGGPTNLFFHPESKVTGDS